MKLNIFEIVLFIFIAELFSLLAFLNPVLMPFVFWALVLFMLILSIKKPEYGIYLLFIELIIGSFGYLFSADFGAFKLSIRIAFFIIIFSVWFLKTLFLMFKEKSLFNFKFLFKDLKYFYFLFFWIVLALINAFFRHTSLRDIFFDFNAWLFFLLIFPFRSAFNAKENLSDLLKVLGASLIWVSLETLFLLFLFSHNFSFLPEIYKWIRDTRVGEITRFNSGFVRIFFQSHIYFLPAFFFVFYKLFLDIKNKKINYQKILFSPFFFLSTLFLSIIILAFSRSNWLGFLFGLFLFFIFLFFKKEGFKNIFRFIGVFILNGIFSLLLISIIINFPLPGSKNNLNALSLVGERASQISSEAGVSSRWNLLPVLWKEIKVSPFLGQGFGKKITYISNDPRVRENNSKGVFETYAFEWGWLDIFLKMGLFGLLSYLILLFQIDFNLFKGLKENNKNKIFLLSLFLGLNMMILVHFFSPYLNHPLGIAYLLLSASIF